MNRIHAFWKFCRPHTIIGTHLQLLAAYLFASRNGHYVSIPPIPLLLCWISAMAMNIYVVGINQLVDVDVDKINKKYLPLASGEFSWRMGVSIVSLSGLIALTLSFALSIYFFETILGIVLIGTLYSLPPIQLKKRPLGAALGIATARGLLFNIGSFVHFNYLMGRPLAIPLYVVALALFIFGFCITIAVMKDIPDVKGDRLHGIRTLAVRMGARVSFRVALSILGICYLAFIVGGFMGVFPSNSNLFGVSHVAFLAFILWKAFSVNPESSSDIYAYYMMIWKMFYLEFAFFIVALTVFP